MAHQSRTQTIAVEEGFKRVKTQSAASSGAAQSASTISSNHVNRAFQSQHRRKRDLLHHAGVARRVKKKRKYKKTTEAKKRRRLRAYDVFLTEQSGKHPTLPHESGMQKRRRMQRDAGVKELWKRAKESPATMARYEKMRVRSERLEKAMEAAEAQRKPAEYTSEETPWQLGDAKFPYSRKLVKAKMRRAQLSGQNLVTEGSQKWRDKYHDFVVDHQDDQFPSNADPGVAQCGQIYGIGYCLYDFTSEQRNNIIDYTDVLSSLIYTIQDPHTDGHLIRIACVNEEVVEKELLLLMSFELTNPNIQVFVLSLVFKCTVKHEHHLLPPGAPSLVYMIPPALHLPKGHETEY